MSDPTPTRKHRLTPREIDALAFAAREMAARYRAQFDAAPDAATGRALAEQEHYYRALAARLAPEVQS